MGVMGIVFGCKNIIIPEVDPELILNLIETEKRAKTIFSLPIYPEKGILRS